VLDNGTGKTQTKIMPIEKKENQARGKGKGSPKRIWRPISSQNQLGAGTVVNIGDLKKGRKKVWAESEGGVWPSTIRPF